MPQPVESAIYCINPDCPRPYPHTWGNKFCNSCGVPLQLNNRYIPLQRLGSGGFATIYTVWDLETEIEQVLKVLVEPSLKALELFEQEAAVLASLRHPGVPRVKPHGYFLARTNKQEPQLPCLVMEKVNGQTLQEMLERHPQGCPEAWVSSWLKQAVEILQELHSRKIIHRDLKPSNLMLRETTGQLVVIDFGGAKIDPVLSYQASSTRLFSSGYSPPEQIAGRGVGPATDFYALGRTMIQLLTGIYPPELADPMTGKLRWRVTSINPDFADLLDELVQEDVTQRPTNAAVIQERLAQISQRSRDQVSIFKLISHLAQTCWNWWWLVASAFSKGISRTTLFLLGVIVQLTRACRDTIWAMVLSVIAVCVSTSVGFVLAYWSPLGTNVATFLSQQLPRLVPETQIAVGSEILIFTSAGLGTAWGLTAAGGFGQRRRYLVAALMGLLGYGLGWLVWRAAMPYGGVESVMGLIVVAVALITLGLGLPSHYLVHAVIASAGTTTLFASMVSLNLFPTPLFHLPQLNWLEFWVYIAFFGFVGVALSFWLGVSYYLVVPCLRFLGWH